MDKYLDYPKDKPIHHNGLPVKYITGSNIHAYGDWDLIIERHNCVSPSSYLGFTVNSASSAVKTMYADAVINHQFLVGDSSKTVSGKLVYGARHADLTATQRVATEREGKYLAYYYDDDYPVMGLKWANGIPTGSGYAASANAPDITNHANKDGYSIIHKFYTTGESLYKVLNASNITELHNLYAPNVNEAVWFIGCCDDFYENRCLKILDNIYLPKAALNTYSAKIEKASNITASSIIIENKDAVLFDSSASTIRMNYGRIGNNVTANNYYMYYGTAGDLNATNMISVKNSTAGDLNAANLISAENSTVGNVSASGVHLYNSTAGNVFAISAYSHNSVYNSMYNSMYASTAYIRGYFNQNTTIITDLADINSFDCHTFSGKHVAVRGADDLKVTATDSLALRNSAFNEAYCGGKITTTGGVVGNIISGSELNLEYSTIKSAFADKSLLTNSASKIDKVILPNAKNLTAFTMQVSAAVVSTDDVKELNKFSANFKGNTLKLYGDYNLDWSNTINFASAYSGMVDYRGINFIGQAGETFIRTSMVRDSRADRDVYLPLSAKDKLGKVAHPDGGEGQYGLILWG